MDSPNPDPKEGSRSASPSDAPAPTKRRRKRPAASAAAPAAAPKKTRSRKKAVAADEDARPARSARKSRRPSAASKPKSEEAPSDEVLEQAPSEPPEASEAQSEQLDDAGGTDKNGFPRPHVHQRVFPSEHLDDDAVKVLRRLHRHGHDAYLVGGVVRDLLLGRRPKDFDVATSARPHEVKALFRNCRIIGRRFRLAHILFYGGKVIETATFRRDPTAGDDDAYVDGPDTSDPVESGELDAFSAGGARIAPRPKTRDESVDLLIRHDNVFGEPHEDALRRDFTINGLFYDLERGEVLDYVGGLPDLERRTIRTIGLPDVRFREDPIRILRAIKFSARIDFGFSPDVYDAMVAQREELRRAAKPRLLEEILRLLRSGAAHRSLWLMWDLGVLSVVLPELAVFLDDDAPRSRYLWGRLDAIDQHVKNGRVPTDAVLLAALLLGPIEESLEGAKDPASAYDDLMHEVNEALAVPRRLKERMRAIVGSQRRLRAGRVGSLPRRDFFSEAVLLFELECAARGVTPPDLPTQDEDAEGDVVVKRRRRRRARR